MFIQVIVDDGFSMEEPVPKEIKARMLSGTAESESGLWGQTSGGKWLKWCSDGWPATNPLSWNAGE